MSAAAMITTPMLAPTQGGVPPVRGGVDIMAAVVIVKRAAMIVVAMVMIVIVIVAVIVTSVEIDRPAPVRAAGIHLRHAAGQRKGERDCN
jgi:hypothetical protein